MRDPVSATRRPRRRDTVLLVAIIAIGASLRLLHLGAPSFWVDEALSLEFARLPWPQFVHLMQTRELNMLPYYLLLRGWIHLGTAEWIVRSLSAIFSIATLPLLYRLGVRLFGVRVGQIGVALLALHPYHIRFAQEARGYSLMILLVTASTLLLVRATETSTRRPVGVWVAYIATSVLAVYAHFYAGFAIIAQWATLAVARPRGLAGSAVALSAAAIGILLVPLAAFVLLGHADPAGWIAQPTSRSVGFLVYSLLGGDKQAGARPLAYAAYAVVLIASGAAARSAWTSHRREPRAWHCALVIAGTSLPIILVLAVSIVKPIFVDKYLMECLPFTVLLLAVGLDRLRPRALSLGMSILILALSVSGVFGYYRRPDKADWRAATRYLLGAARSGDAALFFPRYTFAPFRYYRASLDTSANSVDVVYPGALGDGNVADALSQLEHRDGRLWAVFNQDGDSGSAVRDSLLRRFPVVSDSQFTGVRIVLYDIR